KIKPAIISSIDGVSNDGGNVDLVAGTNVTITSDDAANTITITSAGGGGSPWSESGGNVYRSLGNVGIGTSNPSYNLDVNGTINATGEYRVDGKTALKVENNSIFIGDLAGFFNTTGDYNIFIGRAAGSSNTEGLKNNFIGDHAGSSNTTGSCNTFIGDNAGYYNTTGSLNTFLGNSAGFPNTIGYSNTFIGDSAGASNTTGALNTFIGNFAGSLNTTGENNTFIGRSAGSANTTGNLNTFIGYNAGSSNIIGAYNTFLGNSAGASNATADHNTFIGGYAGSSNTEGNHNTFLGYGTGYSNISGSGNLFLGFGAGSNETGSNKLYIANGSDNSSVLVYGDFLTKRVGIGTTTPSYTLELSGCSGGNCAGKPDGASWATSSDIRLKDIHDDYEYGLTEISLITPVRFSYKEENELGLPSGQELIGLVAQEVQEVIPDAVTEDDNGYLRLNADPVFWAMLNAIKELTSQVQDLKKRVKELEGGKK
ncbi:MAG: tail fiber domain-containing protein, partial [Deltaproteobacteria bacterium]|nr:tail fiber domain-containing protein [Deltaproteobacteria bacterium]